MRAASVYARLGWRVVPLEGKRPLLKDWPNQGSSDLATVQAWANEYPDSNVGVLTGHGFLVVDVDPRNGGNETLAALEEKHGPLPRTVEAKTGGGGRHYYLRVAGTARGGVLGPGVDLKGVGGQVVAPPSVTTGPYEWVNPPWSTEMADAPAWVQIPESEPRQERHPGHWDFPPATPAVLQQARDALAEFGPAVQGRHGDEHTFIACALLRNDFALRDDEAWPLIVEWNATCEPPWSESDLRVKFDSGLKSAKNPYGCRREPDPVAEARAIIAKGGDARAMLRQVRELKIYDKADRKLINVEFESATGLGTLAQDLKLSVRPRVVTGDTGPVYDLSNAGTPLDSANNVLKACTYLTLQEYWDDFHGRILKGDGSEFTDADLAALHIQLQDKNGLRKVPRTIVEQGLGAYAFSRRRNSLREAFESLKWDATPRMEKLCARGFGAADNEYTRAVSRVFLCQIAKRVFEPGCQADYMVILEGDQGIRKSTACRSLVEDRYFAAVKHGPTDKDFFQCLQGKLLLEWAELDSFSRAEASAVKGAVTERTDRYRVSYGRFAEDHPRVTVFIGTTNGDQYLRDETGARRFLPIRCGTIDLEWINANRSQLFAESVQRIKSPDWWHLPLEAAKAEQEARFQHDPWEEVLAKHFEANPQLTTVTVAELLTQVFLMLSDRIDRRSQMRVADALRRLGWVKRDTRSGNRVVKVWRRQ